MREQPFAFPESRMPQSARLSLSIGSERALCGLACASERPRLKRGLR